MNLITMIKLTRPYRIHLSMAFLILSYLIIFLILNISFKALLELALLTEFGVRISIMMFQKIVYDLQICCPLNTGSYLMPIKIINSSVSHKTNHTNSSSR